MFIVSGFIIDLKNVVEMLKSFSIIMGLMSTIYLIFLLGTFYIFIIIIFTYLLLIFSILLI